ncbi:uncharacterized protein EURHEDRAFT_417116 [Aspergillus ruber CBS 135680]|uniref:Uncharacterized protein n=1 Tax=Aspergillus ruber (strain CBS 135680) TaxID=1388766 RepID=A0A017S1J1_ASPRC|nr:uncharacterized protein EURHEDRAFT_417116 [Aspergillus ruber CBS 135680]EYE90817.1 hypothetical protein EURHEDRAFT_417116 [Aspergillus ruber CBS 135680]
MEAELAGFTSGATLRTIETQPGTYHVKQFNNQGLPKMLPSQISKDWHPFNSTIGVVEVHGYTHSLAFDTIAQASIYGIQLGTFSGNPDQRFSIRVDLHFARGTITFSIRGDDVWLGVNMQVVRLGVDNVFESVQCVENKLLHTMPQIRPEPWVPTPMM